MEPAASCRCVHQGCACPRGWALACPYHAHAPPAPALQQQPHSARAERRGSRSHAYKPRHCAFLQAASCQSLVLQGAERAQAGKGTATHHGGLEDDRQAHGRHERPGICHGCHGLARAGHRGHPALLGQLPCLELVPHCLPAGTLCGAQATWVQPSCTAVALCVPHVQQPALQAAFLAQLWDVPGPRWSPAARQLQLGAWPAAPSS